jgi:hypothetical protein
LNFYLKYSILKGGNLNNNNTIIEILWLDTQEQN